MLYSFKHVLWQLYAQDDISFKNHIHHLVFNNCLREGKEPTTEQPCHVEQWPLLRNKWINPPFFTQFNKLWNHFFLVNQFHQFQTSYLWNNPLDNHIIHSQWWWFVHLVFHVPSSSRNNNQIHHNTSFTIIVYWVTMFIHQFNHKFIKVIPSNNQNVK